jgi:protoporphyrinogen oxidase
VKVAIIGAGPAGLTAAYQLSKHKEITLDIYEAGAAVGGLSKTISLWGYKVDLGPHRFFSSDQRVNKLWLEIAGDDYLMVNRLTRIYYKDNFFDYPLSPWNALSNLGLFEATYCVFSYLKTQLKPLPENGDFESWVSNRFGKRLYEIFFRSYSEKLWGIPCHELDADFAAQRIKKLSLYETIKNAFFGSKQQEHKTLVDQFAYPKEGTGMIYDRMINKAVTNGVIIHLQTPVQEVLVRNGRAYGLVFNDGKTRLYDHIISTMPLTQLVKRMDGMKPSIIAKSKQLTYRNTLLVYLHIDSSDLFPDNWLYIHSNKLRMGRITNFRNWVPQLYSNQSGSVLSVEYWCNKEDDLWQAAEEDIIKLATKELRENGLIKDQKILSGKVYPIPKCYPVYKKGYREILEPIERELSKIKGLSVIGRYGAFKYNNQDHSILMGILAAENIVKASTHDLWGINTDYDSYQEQSTITESGLIIDQ